MVPAVSRSQAFTHGVVAPIHNTLEFASICLTKAWLETRGWILITAANGVFATEQNSTTKTHYT